MCTCVCISGVVILVTVKDLGATYDIVHVHVFMYKLDFSLGTCTLHVFYDTTYTVHVHADMTCLSLPLSEEPNFGTWRINANLKVRVHACTESIHVHV